MTERVCGHGLLQPVCDYCLTGTRPPAGPLYEIEIKPLTGTGSLFEVTSITHRGLFDHPRYTRQLSPAQAVEEIRRLLRHGHVVRRGHSRAVVNSLLALYPEGETA